MKFFVWGLIVLLMVLHQDFWFWSDGRLLFGFLPIGIGYHVGISLAAAVVWFLATKYACPDGLETPHSRNQEGPADV